jgi:hypothetical protein
MIATFGDGSGNHREADGSSRAGWRELERIFAEFLTGKKHSEDKHVFDVIAADWDNAETSYGLSVKSKIIKGPRSIFSLYETPRAYLEIANSPAKMWQSITSKTGFSAEHFNPANGNAQRIGDALIDTIQDWKIIAKTEFERTHPDQKLDLSKSIYLTLSFSEYLDNSWDVHICSFPMNFPKIQWTYSSDRCLSANDPTDPGQRLIDWYPNSGGQLKYYPLFSGALYSSSIMKIKVLKEISIIQKTFSCFDREALDIIPHLNPKQVALLNKLTDSTRDGI